ncbi:XrtY-associated glycosyltransferase XYAG1 [Pedobacter sp. Leaf194]|uniref:XrtY-associated glycosyltransferase XYAG1 n=1 Tax=Pedobacter sp. Leaf194 TaxID=1736297 RepID=UPI000702B6FE|nr:glycosyltransferase [Pedobacter sp. Leaf194]KQS36139.1 hypothetical protein ASG14_11950 [Pedobacter sp. Leaf194]
MKIIHITPSYKPAYIYGGTIQSVGKLCEALMSFDFAQEYTTDVEVLTTTASGKYELSVDTGKQHTVDGVPVTYFKRWTKDHSHFSPRLMLELRKVIRKARYNKNDEIIIHIHAWWNLVSVLSCLVAKWYQIPVILSPRGMLTAYTQTNRNSIVKTLFHKLIGERLLQYSHIHATSPHEQIDILKIVQPKNITVIPNLVQLADSVRRKAERISTDFSKLIFLSRIEEKKGLELLLEAMSKVEIAWKLTIAGTGDENYVQSLKQKVEALKLRGHIDWLGHVNNEDKYHLIAAHDLMVLPSYSENFANVVIESLSVGTPVLVSDKVGLADYILEKNLGWVTSLDIKEIGNKLTAAAEDKLKRNAIRALAPGQIREDFNDEVLARRYLALYKTVIGEAHRKS